MSSRHYILAACLSLFSIAIMACSSSDSGSTGSSGTPGTCSGSFESCKFGTLSQTQIDEFCDTALTISGAKPGTTKTCMDGTTITIVDKAQCVQNYLNDQKCSALGALTGKQMLDCAAAGLQDPCNVVDSKACTPVVDALSKCM
jgi:hypothetical protein